MQSYNVVGTKGNIVMDPGYMYGKSLAQASTIGKDESTKSFKNTDHFGGELKYFSDCILNNKDPEPDAEEGYADVRVLEGILESLKTGKSVQLEPFARLKRIDPFTQVETLSAQSSPELINTSNPGKDQEKVPKN